MTLDEVKAQLSANGQVQLKVKVAPKAARSLLVGFRPDGTLKVKVQAPPERGKANAELRAVLGKEFGVAPRQVSILTGETSSLKQVRIWKG